MSGLPDTPPSGDRGDVDLRALRADICDEGGDLVLVATDGESMIRFRPGLGGSAQDAVSGARALSAAAWHYADLLAVRLRADLPATHSATFRARSE